MALRPAQGQRLQWLPWASGSAGPSRTAARRCRGRCAAGPRRGGRRSSGCTVRRRAALPKGARKPPRTLRLPPDLDLGGAVTRRAPNQTEASVRCASPLLYRKRIIARATFAHAQRDAASPGHRAPREEGRHAASDEQHLHGGVCLALRSHYAMTHEHPRGLTSLPRARSPFLHTQVTVCKTHKIQPNDTWCRHRHSAEPQLRAAQAALTAHAR